MCFQCVRQIFLFLGQLFHLRADLCHFILKQDRASLRENNLSLYLETGCGKLEGDELLQEKVPLCYCDIGPDQKLVEATS